MPDQRLLVIVPTLNERDNLETLFTGIRAHCPDADILIIDDASADGTADWAEELGRRLGRIAVLRREGRFGIGSAYRDGMRRGLAEGYDRFVTMDADLSHDPKYLPALVALTEAADVGIGSRYVRGISVVNWDLKRLAVSVGGNRYARLVTRLPVNDCTSGFQCFRREVLERIDVGRLRSQRVRLPRRAQVSRVPARLPSRGTADHLRRPSSGTIEERDTDRLHQHVGGVDDAAAARVARDRNARPNPRTPGSAGSALVPSGEPAATRMVRRGASGVLRATHRRRGAPVPGFPSPVRSRHVLPERCPLSRLRERPPRRPLVPRGGEDSPGGRRRRGSRHRWRACGGRAGVGSARGALGRTVVDLRGALRQPVPGDARSAGARRPPDGIDAPPRVRCRRSLGAGGALQADRGSPGRDRRRVLPRVPGVPTPLRTVSVGGAGGCRRQRVWASCWPGRQS